MKIHYYADTDTLHIEFRATPVAETRDLDENTLLDVDADGNICAIAVEHASERAGVPQFSYEQVATANANGADAPRWRAVLWPWRAAHSQPMGLHAHRDPGL